MKGLLRYAVMLSCFFVLSSCGGGGGEEEPPIVKSTACDLTSFSLKIATNLTSYPGGWVAVSFNGSRVANVVVEKPEISLTSIQAKFTISAKASITVGSTPQVSEVTANNYTNAVVFRVTAEDGVTFKNYTVNVTRVVP